MCVVCTTKSVVRLPPTPPLPVGIATWLLEGADAVLDFLGRGNATPTLDGWPPPQIESSVAVPAVTASSGVDGLLSSWAAVAAVLTGSAGSTGEERLVLAPISAPSSAPSSRNLIRARRELAPDAADRRGDIEGAAAAGAVAWAAVVTLTRLRSILLPLPPSMLTRPSPLAVPRYTPGGSVDSTWWERLATCWPSTTAELSDPGMPRCSATTAINAAASRTISATRNCHRSGVDRYVPRCRDDPCLPLDLCASGQPQSLLSFSLESRGGKRPPW